MVLKTLCTNFCLSVTDAGLERSCSQEAGLNAGVSQPGHNLT